MSKSIITSATHLLVAGLAAALIAGSAAAQRPSETFAFRFSYAGASLKSEAGARSVYAELNSKARTACRSDTRMTSVQQRTAGECAHHLVNQTVAAINSPRLSQVHTGLAAVQFAAQ